jgi:hypothetical protein
MMRHKDSQRVAAMEIGPAGIVHRGGAEPAA